MARVIVAAYRVASRGGEWDPKGGQTTLDRVTVAPAERLGQLLADAGRADYKHGIAPGPVVPFTGLSLILDLRFGDPDEDARAVEAIAQGFAELGLSRLRGIQEPSGKHMLRSRRAAAGGQALGSHRGRAQARPGSP